LRAFKSYQDIYGFTAELINLANRSGDPETARLLHDALRNNFTASEILGDLRIVLKRLSQEKGKAYLAPFRGDIKGLIHAVNKALRSG
jgi:hypothetical protein